MLKEKKRKLFVILMALTLIVTLMPTIAFAEESTTERVEVKRLNVAMLECETDGEGNKIVIDKEQAKNAEFVLAEQPGTGPMALTENPDEEGSKSLREYIGTVKYEDNQAVIEFNETIEIGTYILSEKTAPTGYSVLESHYEIVINKDGAGQLVASELAPIPEKGLEFVHEKKAEVSISINKIVNGDAAPDETFTAKLSIYRSTEPVIDETETTPFKLYSEETTSFKKGTSTITFYVDGAALDGSMLYLEEVNEAKTGWTYDPQVYCVIPNTDEDGHVYCDIQLVGAVPEEQELKVVNFTNTYTKPYNGGGSTTRYYDVKVNNGKALSITGAELSRVVAGTTINAVADPAAEGKVFKGWEVVKGGITVGEADRFTFAMPHEDVEITAVYEDKAEPVTPAEPEDPAAPDDEEEQPEDYDGPVPKTGDAQAAELVVFAALMLMAAFGLKKVYNK